MTVLIVANGEDPGAAAVAATIAARRGPRSVFFVTPWQLATASSWTHTVSARGTASTEIVTASGSRLGSDDVTAVLNRMDGIPPVRFARSTPRDRDYAVMELHALVVSWLSGLPGPVVNPMTGNGPAHQRPELYWLLAAQQAGVPVRRLSRATSARALAARSPARSQAPPGTPKGAVLVVGRHAHGALASLFGHGCIEVAEKTGCPLLEFRFVQVGGDLLLAEVNPRPALLKARAVTAVAEYLIEVTT